MADRTEFFNGWLEALESLETRLKALRLEMTSRTTANDVILDVMNEVKDLKAISLDLTITD